MSTRLENLQVWSVFRNSTNHTILASATSTFNSPWVTSQPSTQSGRLASIWAPSSFSALLIVFVLSRGPSWRAIVCQARLAHDRPGPADFPLQLHDAVNQRFGGWRAAGHINVDRNDPVTAAHNGIAVVVIAAAICA